MLRGLRRRWAGLLLATLLATTGLSLSGWRAAADEPKAYVTVSIDAMSPALPKRDGTLRLRGRVINTSHRELTNLQAAFWRSLDPITDREGMDRALGSAANEPLGARVKPLTLYQNLATKQDRTLAPGQSTTFDLTVQVADLELPTDDAVYLIGIHVLGRTEPTGPDITLGRGRIFLPLVTHTTRNRLQLTSVVVLASRPSWVRAGVLADDHLAAEVATGGRLQTLLDAARSDDASFAVDPALIEELETMRAGYQVLGVDGSSTSPGSGQSAADQWLTDFARLRRSGDGFRLLYGNPDVAALVHRQQTEVLADAVQAGDAVAATRSLPLLVWPGSGRADAATLAAISALDPKAILLSDKSAKGPGPLLAGPGPAPILSYSSAAFGGGPGPAPTDTPAKLRQRMLADTWIEASTAGTNDTIGRIRLITSADQAVGADTGVQPPWMRATTLSGLLRGTPSVWPGKLRYTAKASTAEIPPAQTDAVRGLAADYGTAADLFVQPRTIQTEARRVLPRVASSAWRTEPDSGAAYASTTQRRLTVLLRDGVKITAVPRVRTTGRSASFPITVRNDLPTGGAADPTGNTVQVSLRFDSDNSQRLTISPISLPPVEAGERVTDNAQVQAQTNGTVRVTAQLYTRSGKPIGKAVPIQVNATQAGTTGWFIAIAAGIVLVGTTALRIRQVTRERGQAGGADPVVVSRPAQEQDGVTGPGQTTQASSADVARETLDV